MAGNVLTSQILVDGPRNTVVKIVGVLDTSDVAATGTIGASGFTTTTGSNAIAFVAGALLPTLGQYVTFGDSAATFVAGTYITSIIDATHITVNNVALKDNAAAAVTITGTAGVVVIADPAVLSDMVDSTETKATKLRIDKIKFTGSDALLANLYWKATASVAAFSVTENADLCFKKFGGLQNNAGTGVNGQITLSTAGWGSGTKIFTLILELVKQ